MSDAELFTDQPKPVPQDPALFTDEPAPSWLGQLGQNLKTDVKNNWKSVTQDIPEAFNQSLSMVTQDPSSVLETPAAQMVKNIPSALVSEGKRLGVGEALTGHPINALQKFRQAAYEKPITTGLDLSPFLAKGASALMGGEEAATQAAKEALPAAAESAAKEIPDSAAIAKSLPPPPAVAQGGAPLSSLAAKAESLIPEAEQKAGEVKNYISRGYEGFAKQPGHMADIADYFQDKSQSMALQQMGLTPGQFRRLGASAKEAHDAARAVGQYGLDSGIVSPTNGLRGMIEKNSDLTESIGKELGDYRKAADKVTGGYQPGELLQAVKAKLDPKYLRGVSEENPAARGVHGSEAGSYQRALQEIEDAGNTHADAAGVATTLNKFANDANRINQPHNAYTDLANTISEINNERVKSALGPDLAQKYEQRLREFGVNKKIQAALKYKSGGEVKRMGPGSLTREFFQKGMDELGYKVGAKALNKLSTSVKNSPAIGQNLPSLFKEFINHVENQAEELTGQ